jgi:hypothetical protein
MVNHYFDLSTELVLVCGALLWMAFGQRLVRGNSVANCKVGIT